MGVVLCILMTVVGWLVECGSAHTQHYVCTRKCVARAHWRTRLRYVAYPAVPQAGV